MFFQSAEAAKASSQAAVLKARADVEETKAKLDAAKADVNLKKALIKVAGKDRDHSQALADYKALSQQLITDVAYIPLFYSVGAFLIKPYVSGAGTNTLFDFGWNQVQILYH